MKGVWAQPTKDQAPYKALKLENIQTDLTKHIWKLLLFKFL